MKSKLVSEDGGRTFVLILDQGEEAFAAVTAFANEDNYRGVGRGDRSVRKRQGRVV